MKEEEIKEVESEIYVTCPRCDSYDVFSLDDYNNLFKNSKGEPYECLIKCCICSNRRYLSRNEYSIKEEIEVKTFEFLKELSSYKIFELAKKAYKKLKKCEDGCYFKETEIGYKTAGRNGKYIYIRLTFHNLFRLAEKAYELADALKMEEPPMELALKNGVKDVSYSLDSYIKDTSCSFSYEITDKIVTLSFCGEAVVVYNGQKWKAFGNKPPFTNAGGLGRGYVGHGYVEWVKL